MKLLSNHYDAIFFSPHLDDVVLSQGGTIAKLTAEEKEVLVVTIFTQGESSPISGGGKNFLKKCGKTGVREMFIDRKKEDKNAGRVLGFDTLHLGYNADIYRLRPKTLINSYFPYLRFIHPSLKKAFRGKISSADTTLQGRIKKDLKSIIKKYGKPGTKIYGPLGVGDHVDHLIVFEALNSLRIKNLFFWEDVPYSKQEKIKKRLKDLAKRKLRFSPQKVDINKHANLKKKAIFQYTSQIPMLFPDGLIVRAYETYYKKINKNSLVLTNSGEEFIKPLTRLDTKVNCLAETEPISQKIIRNTVFNVFGNSLTLVITILLTPFIVRKLGLFQFGVLAVVNVFIAHVNLLDFGIKTSLVKHLAGLYKKKDFININRLVNTGLLFCGGSALIVAVLGFVLAEQFLALFRISTPFIGDALVAFRLAIISFFIFNLGAVFVATQTGLQKMDMVNKIKMVSSLLYALGAVFFLQAGLGLKGLMLSRLGASAGESVLNVLMTFKILPLLKLSFSLVNKKALARLFNFGIKVQVGELANVVRSYIGNFLVARYLGVELSGFYEIATKIVNQVGAFPPMIISAVLPAVSELHSQKDNKKLYRLYWQGTKYLSLLAIPMVVFVFVLAPLIIQAWLGSGFEKTVPVLRLMILGLGLTFFTGLPTLFFQGTGEVQYTMYGAFVALLLHIFLGFVFVIKFGFIGPALGVFISVLLATIFFLNMFYKKVGWPIVPVITKLILPLFFVNITLLSLVYFFNVSFWGLFLNKAWQATVLGIEFSLVIGIDFLVAWKTGYLDSRDKKLFWDYITLLGDKLLRAQKTPRWEGPRDDVERVYPDMLHGRVFYEHYRRYQFAMGFVRGRKVLDAACGTGYGSALLAREAKRVVGIDYDLETIKQCQQDYQRSNLHFVHGNVTSLNFPENNFDVIVSFETLEHVKNFRRCLSEFKRVLKPDGLLLLSVPNVKFDDPNSPYHVNKFSQWKLKKELTRYFEEVKILGQRYTAKGEVSITESLLLTDKSLVSCLCPFLGNVFFSFSPKTFEKLRRYLYLRKMAIAENNLNQAEAFLVVCKN